MNETWPYSWNIGDGLKGEIYRFYYVYDNEGHHRSSNGAIWPIMDNHSITTTSTNLNLIISHLSISSYTKFQHNHNHQCQHQQSLIQSQDITQQIKEEVCMYFIHDPQHNNNIYFVFVVLLLLERDLFLNIDLVREQQYYIDCLCSLLKKLQHILMGLGLELRVMGDS